MYYLGWLILIKIEPENKNSLFLGKEYCRVNLFICCGRHLLK